MPGYLRKQARDWLCAVTIALLLSAQWGCAPAQSESDGSTDWTDWQRFKQRFVQEDGRVIDLTFGQKSTSEGQGYGLFFALVANDKERFAAILRWIELNLAGRKLGENLPSWHWGKHEDGQWKTIDSNSAADGDLWIAHSLLEAGRLWNRPDYAATGRSLLAQIAARETVLAGETGPLLLPAPVGFVLEGGRYHIDPSYIPPFQFRYLETVDPEGPWGEILANYIRMSPRIFSAGVAPDTLVVDSRDQVFADTQRTPRGSYDAIRVYMWAGMSGADGAAQLKLLQPFVELIREKGVPPEKLDPVTGEPIANEWAPIGFSAAVLPFLKALDERELIEKQLKRLERDRAKSRLARNANYYDEALVLFGKGWYDGRYRFDEQGYLHTKWSPQP